MCDESSDGLIAMRRSRLRVEGSDSASVQTYWRRLPAEHFDAGRRADVTELLAPIRTTIDLWRLALDGDAAAAVAVALGARTPQHIDPATDIVMTVLLRCALDNAGAALVLSRKLSPMPIDPKLRGRLAASWLVCNAGRARRSRRIGQTIAAHLSEGGRS